MEAAIEDHGRHIHVGATLSVTASGYCTLPDALTAGRADAIRAEATSLASHARRADGNYYCVNADGSISSPRRLSTAAAGSALQAIHHDESLLDRLADILGRRIAPTRGSYIYYEPGDYIGLHKDAAVCTVTLIGSIAGALASLVIHPALVDVPAEQLVATSRAHSAMPPGGVRVAIPDRGSFLLLLGSKIPHHRPATLDRCMIATLCYA